MYPAANNIIIIYADAFYHAHQRDMLYSPKKSAHLFACNILASWLASTSASLMHMNPYALMMMKHILNYVKLSWECIRRRCPLLCAGTALILFLFLSFIQLGDDNMVHILSGTTFCVSTNFMISLYNFLFVFRQKSSMHFFTTHEFWEPCNAYVLKIVFKHYYDFMIAQSLDC